MNPHWTTTHDDHVEMTDEEVAEQVGRADRFIEQLRDAITATVVDPASRATIRRGLQRIASTLDAGPYVTSQMANLNTAMRGGLLA